MSRHGRAEADAGVVDEHVQAAVALAVRGDDLLDLGLLGDVGGNRLHVEALRGEPADGGLELLRPPRGHRDGVALLAEHPARSPARSRSKPP